MELIKKLKYVLFLGLFLVSFHLADLCAQNSHRNLGAFKAKGFIAFIDSTNLIYWHHNRLDTLQIKESFKLAVTKSGRLFFGSQKEFGYFNLTDSLSFISLKSLFYQQKLNIKQLAADGERIIMVADRDLVLYNGKELKYLIQSANQLKLGTVHDSLCIWKNGHHLYKVQNEKAVAVPIEGFGSSGNENALSFWYIYLILGVVISMFFGFLLQKQKRMYIKQRKELEADKIKQIENLVNQNNRLVKQNQKNEDLVANLLPQKTANEIKVRGKAQSQRFDMATVLFADIQGFTKIAEQVNPEYLIDELDRIFFHFDSIIEKYNIEKIKTIGDAYMCAGGIPKKNSSHPVDVILAALEMQHYLKKLHQQNRIFESKIWDLRIGIHSGPVIAGVIGKKRFSYDIWGDSVNIAARMQSSGEIGKVNISNMTYNLVKSFFKCEYRGRMPVKFKGDLEMYFVTGILPDLADGIESAIPNEKFKLKLSYLHYEDLESEILVKIENEIPKNIYFHDSQRAKELCIKVELFALSEQIPDEEILNLKTAALFHEVGFIHGYNDRFNFAMDKAREILPVFGYRPEQIEAICKLICSINIPPAPKNKFEEILNDANLDYLAKQDFKEQSLNFYKELVEYNLVTDMIEWYKYQIELLTKYDFFTQSANKMAEVKRKDQIKEVVAILKNDFNVEIPRI
jgi:adenylate cyclase